MRAKLVSLNHCAVPFLSRATVNLSWYDSIYNCAQRLDIAILLTKWKTTAAQNEVALSYHRVCGLYFLAVVFLTTKYLIDSYFNYVIWLHHYFATAHYSPTTYVTAYPNPEPNHDPNLNCIHSICLTYTLSCKGYTYASDCRRIVRSLCNL